MPWTFITKKHVGFCGENDQQKQDEGVTHFSAANLIPQ
jgi:hypothetical protein